MGFPDRARHKQFYGIAEWYGRLFRTMDGKTRSELAASGSRLGAHPCPFLQDVPRLGPKTGNLNCKKPGGVCSIRNFHDPSASDGLDFGPITTTCPNRFLEGGTIVAHIGREVLGCEAPLVAKEIPFLKRSASVAAQLAITDEEEEADASDPTSAVIDKEDVGKIDLVLVDPDRPENWCAVEIQAVYFSGKSMAGDITAISTHSGNGFPGPSGARRPDFRSSGPKRLMPQLMIKVPTLRRWGKKMVVVVDSEFHGAMDAMDRADHISNSDIVWIVADFDEDAPGDRAKLFVKKTVLSTLEESVKALTSGRPTTLTEFEAKLAGKTQPLWPKTT